MKFSISICVYGKDNPDHFKQAMDSIINQTVLPDEIVLVVDGPIPNSIQTIINTLADKFLFIKVIYLKINSGHGQARKIGLENCSYDLIAIMDADDICVSDRFEKQLRCFEKDNELSIVGGNIKEFVNNVNNVVGIREVPENDLDIKKYLKNRCPFNQTTVMFKKNDVETVGGYIDWYCEEDYYLWIRMLLNKCKFKNLKDCLVNVRVCEDMYNRRGGWKYFKSEAKLQLYMLKQKIISIPRFIYNITGRFIIQVLLPNNVRGFVFQKLFRKQIKI